MALLVTLLVADAALVAVLLAMLLPLLRGRRRVRHSCQGHQP